MVTNLEGPKFNKSINMCPYSISDTSHL